ncbi:hypothetical protein KFU94_48715 [Chloroflexi bacterium TSY]|nr:hypothetical protein [Chloroflexi bacterium TSY]
MTYYGFTPNEYVRYRREEIAATAKVARSIKILPSRLHHSIYASWINFEILKGFFSRFRHHWFQP